MTTTGPPTPSSNETVLISYLKQLTTVRTRTAYLLKYPNYLTCFDVFLDKLPLVTEHVLDLVKRDYPTLADIPPHSRWRHFEAVPQKPLNPTLAADKFITVSDAKLRIHRLLNDTWKGVDELEKVVRLLDLFVVSVLLDGKLSSGDNP